MYGAYFCCKRALHGTYGVQMWHLCINDISTKKMELSYTSITNDM